MKYLVVLVVMMVVVLLIMCIVGASNFNGHIAITHLALCQEYERNKSIPVGSCDCAQRIYPEFDKSYDWMDACAIEEAKSKPLVEASP